MTTSVKKILLVDDEERLLDSMAQRLLLMGFEVIKASSGTQAIQIASNTKMDMAIVDLKMPDMDGLITIVRLKEIIPDLKTVLLTGYGSEKIRHETEALDSGYFEKDSMGGLWDVIKQFNTQDTVVGIKPSSSTTGVPSRKNYFQNEVHPSPIEMLNDHYEKRTDQQIPRANVDSIGRSFGDLPKIIGETPEMQLFRKNIERMAGLDCTIIIQGETGTGKELAARAIHALSHRKGQRFLAFNCGCFSNDFHFNELLGSIEEPGLNQDLIKTRTIEKGFIGTILLDHFEIMPEQTQREMMKIIDHKASNQPMDVVEAAKDIRFIVATHQDLNKRVEQSKFNKNLYHKLNAIVLSVPSLKERRDDIFPLCSYFLNKLNKDFKKNIKSISDEVLSIFMSYPFPGNVRELKHLIERAVILADHSTIELKHLPERFREQEPTSPLIENEPLLTLNQIEQNHILKVLQTTGYNKSKAAEVLGISRAALWRKLKLINAQE